MTEGNSEPPANAPRTFGALANYDVNEERHGEAVLHSRDGSVFAAQNVTLPNGTRAKPTCITLPKVPFERSVWLRPLADSSVEGKVFVQGV